jgi:hypothetical protein
MMGSPDQRLGFFLFFFKNRIKTKINYNLKSGKLWQ